MIRQLPIVLAFGLASAVLYAAALTGVALGLFLTYLAQLPLFIVGLWLGVRAAAVAGAAAVVALTLFGGALPGALFAISTALPVAFLVMLALRKRVWTDGKEYWYPPGNLLRSLALWCVFLLVGAAVLLALLGDGFSAAVTVFLSRVSEVIEQSSGLVASPIMIEQMARILPGIVMWSWMLMSVVNGILAQALLTKAGRNIRPSMRMNEIEVPLTWSILFGAAVALSYVLPGDLGFTVVSVAMVLAFPLLFQGLSVVHAALASFGAWTLGYIAFYMVIILFSWLTLAVVALGMAEPVFKLRARLARPKNT